MALVTTDDLAAFAQLTIPETGDIADQAAAACAWAHSIVEAYCRRPLEQATSTSTPVVIQYGRADLPHTPVISVASVTVDSAVVPATDYVLDAAGTLHFDRSLTGVATITYTHGFAEGDYRIKAAQSVAVRIAHRLWVNPNDRTSFSPAGAQSASWSTTPDLTRLLTMDERAVLAPCVDMRGIG